jgi:hypothetical protein
VVSDRGTPFINEAMDTWLSDAGVEHRATTAYNQKANGDAESEVKNFKREIEKLLDGDPNWDLKLDETAMLMRYKIKSDPGVSPYEIRFGKPMRLLKHLRFGAVEPRSLDATRRQEVLKAMYKREDERALAQKEIYDRSHKKTIYKKGDRVWIKLHDVATFGARRDGPFEIVEKLDDLNYRVGEIGKAKLNNKHPIFHVNNMDRYEPEIDEDEEGAEYHVKEVVNHRKSNGELEFEVKWSTGETTWEPIEYLIDVDESGKRTVNKQLKKYAQEKRVRLIMRQKDSD